MTDLTFQKATKKRVKARIAIDGPSGSGKTYTALVAATALAEGGKIAVIDTERGSASLYSDEFSFDVLELTSYHPDNYVKAIRAAESERYPVIVIDSLTHAWEGEGGALDLADEASRRQKTPNSYTAWKEVTPLHRKMVDAILNSSAHVIVTMRSKMEYVQEKDPTGRTTIRKIGLAPIQRAGMEYEFTLVGDMDPDHNIVITKSRCHFLADAVESKPGVAFFAKFRDWLNDGAPQPQPAPIRQTIPVSNPEPASSPANFSPDPLPLNTVDHQPITDLSYEAACAVTNSRGATYGSLDSNILKFMSGSIFKALQDPTKSQEEADEYSRKLTAIETILKHREA